ncbi:MAG: sortase domain-containing protein [Egibacteraceae bacterium]
MLFRGFLVLVVALALVLMTVVVVRDARAAVSELPMLSIPALGLRQPLSRNVDRGPVLYWRDGDTYGIAGHRTTHGAPFRRLNELTPGTKLWVDGRAFVVARQVRVRPWDTWILNWRGVVMTACDPPGSDHYRLAVLAREVT